MINEASVSVRTEDEAGISVFVSDVVYFPSSRIQNDCVAVSLI